VKKFPVFMGPEGLLLCSEEPTNGHCLEPVEPISHPQNLFFILVFLIYDFHFGVLEEQTCVSLKWVGPRMVLCNMEQVSERPVNDWTLFIGWGTFGGEGKLVAY
jgi:hypothetical protein